MIILDGTTITLRPGSAGWSEETLPLFEQVRMPGGLLRSSLSATSYWFRRWTGRTPFAVKATITPWEALLKSPGIKVVSGYAVNGSTINVYTHMVKREQHPVTNLLSLSFVLDEADPTAP